MMILAIAALGVVPGCAEKTQPADPNVTAPLTALDPVPAPEGLAAEVFIPLPDAVWKKARTFVGGPAAFLPQTFGGLITMAVGLPVGVTSHIDEDLPAFGAIASIAGTPQLRAVLGVHVKAGDRFVDQLTKGEGARFTASRDAATSITLLTPKGTVKGPVTIGVLGNYLLIGREPADLTHVGPYVARTLPKATIPKEDIALEIPDAALAGTITKLFQEQRSALLKVGEAVSPAIPLDRTLGRLVEIGPDLTRARLTVELDESWVHVRLASSPKAGDGPAARALRDMAVGDTIPLRELPDETLVGFLDRDPSAARAASSTSYAEAVVRALKAEKTMPEEDKKAIEAAMRDVAEARGDWVTGGLSFGATGPVGFVRGAVADKDKLDKGLQRLLETQKLKSVSEALKASGFKVTMKKTVVEGIAGDVQRIRIEKIAAETAKDGAKAGDKGAAAKPSGKGAAPAPTVGIAGAPDLLPTTIDLLYAVREGAIYAAAGYDAKAGLVSVVEAPGGTNMGGVAEIKAALDALGSEVSFAIVVDPLRLVASRAGKPEAASPAPLVLSLGRSTGEAAAAGGASMWLRLDVAAPAVRELIKQRNSLLGP